MTRSVKKVEEDAPTNSVAGGGVALPADAKFKSKYMGVDVTDKRRRKDKQPRILKRFRIHAGYK